MYPNPQDVLPLPPRPSLEHYKKRAKDLVKACKTGGPAAIRIWVAEWLEAVATLYSETGNPPSRERVQHRVDQIEQFAQSKLRRADSQHSTCALADTQFVIARVHGFTSWPAFAQHLDALVRASSVSAFEKAADAIVSGDLTTLQRLLQEDPNLIRERSTRAHRATLLHYVAANGVENYRQETPHNVVAITELLLNAGADVHAQADVYGGGADTLGLAATSVHPFKAGVQNDLIDILLKHGASLEQGLVGACLANGRPEAADHLVRLGASVDLEEAAGVGRLDLVKGFFNDDGRLTPNATEAQMKAGFALACMYGHADVVDFLIDRGAAVDARMGVHGRGHTGLHVAAFHAHVDVVRTLLRRRARVDVTDDTWGTPPLVWALYAWRQERAAAPERYYAVVAMLVAAGAAVKPEWIEREEDSRMRAALAAQMTPS